MNIIEQIKAEIERLKAKYRKDMYKSNREGLASGYKIEAYNELLPFLSTLESERPESYNPVYDEAYLNEKIKKATESWKGVDVDAMLAECRGYDEEKSEKPMQEGLEEEIKRYYDDCDGDCRYTQTARHFAKWGAEHLKK